MSETTDAAARRNRRAARLEFEIWSNGDIARLDELVAPDVVHHDPYDPHAADGIEGLRRSIAATHATFQDFRIAVEDQVAEGDRVATRWTATMTRREDGRRLTLRGITIERFEDGRVVESWRSMDMLGLMRELGAAPGDG
jgi:steroid delta-isomerase-like uncharacterized protein